MPPATRWTNRPQAARVARRAVRAVLPGCLLPVVEGDRRTGLVVVARCSNRAVRDRAPSRPGMPFSEQLSLLTLADLAGCHDRVQLEAAIRRRCQTVGVDAQTILCRILGRYKFFVDRR